MLKEMQLFGPVDLVEKSIARLREFEAQAVAMHPDGYWLAFSGGKDSIVILDLAIKAGVKFTAHFNVTTVDPPELLQFIRDNYPKTLVKWEKAELSMWKLIEKKMMPPTRIVRYCCEHLKERGGKNRFVVTGIRWGESARRSNRRMTEVCFRNSRTRYLHPIIEWSDSDVWQYIRENKLPYCRLYDEGFKRIGCVGCPSAGSGRAKEFARWPRFEAAYRKAFAKIAQTGTAANRKLHWENGDDVFDWWMDDSRNEPDNQDQGVLFE